MINKEALKQKMGKTIKIEISVKNDGHGDASTDETPDLQKSSDLAPVVKDSEEPGVVKSDDLAGKKDALPIDEMLKHMPTPAPNDPTSLNARARRGMMDKLDAKKGLKV